MTTFLRRGMIIRHTVKKKKGVVIDWGVTGAKYRKYVISKKPLADSVRVWTGQRIEVWPLPEVAFDEN
ncbi:MAG: hypothetical protein M0Z48_12790 [Nitrospiraceae bacterium]|nr:hypothetical protein [Nitrospiraceae bacterium]